MGMRRENHEDGMIMVEAIYVVVIAVIVIFFGFNVAIMYHNRILMTAIADEAATSVANTYGVPGKEPFYSYMDEEDYKKWNPYRYLIYGKDVFNKAVEKKCKWYASFLVSESEFRSGENMDFSGVKVKCGLNDKAGVMQVTVAIKREYPAFIMNPVSFFGLDPNYTVETAGTAVCYDVIHQMNTVAFTNEIMSKAEDIPGLDFLGKCKDVVDSALELWGTDDAPAEGGEAGGGGGGGGI